METVFSWRMRTPLQLPVVLEKLPTMKTVTWLLFSVNMENWVFSREGAALHCQDSITSISYTRLWFTLQQNHVISSTNQIVVLILIIAFSHFVIIYTLRVIIYQKNHESTNIHVYNIDAQSIVYYSEKMEVIDQNIVLPYQYLSPSRNIYKVFLKRFQNLTVLP